MVISEESGNGEPSQFMLAYKKVKNILLTMGKA